MKRRSFLKHLATLPILSGLWKILPNSTQAAGLRSDARRVRPSDASWPGKASWEKLNQGVGGRLIRVQSPFAHCQDAPDACQETIKNLQNPFYIGDQVGATQSTGWVDGWISEPSAYAVAARNTDDVVAAVNFARENNLRLVVKGGGHSYQGTSNAADSLLIWTRALNNIVLHDAFVGQGCEELQAPQPAVSIGSGAMWIDAYNAVTTEAGRYVQGGGCATVGVAGLIQSGGFGSFSKNYGMAAAGLLEAEMVTADGVVRIINACRNPDLFWAIKGGGGGSMGVITRITLRTRELPAYFGAVTATIQATSDAAFRLLIGQFMSFYRDNLFNFHWGESVGFQRDNKFAIRLVFQGLDHQQVDTIWAPFFYWVKQSTQEFEIAEAPKIGSIPARRAWDVDYVRQNLAGTGFSMVSDPRPGAPVTHAWWMGNQEEVGRYWHGYESVWLPASLLDKEQRTSYADALFAATRHWKVALHFNKGLAGAPPEAIAAARDTATNPAVLDAFALAIIAGGGRPVYPGIAGYEPDLVASRKNAAAISRSMDELRKVVPDAGAYVSEANFFDQRWQQSFWGLNYPRLRSVKAKYDPAGLFFVHHGVGSEAWSSDGFERLT